ncbi:WD40 repeat domain-containing protein [Aquirufa nivalisilvae]|uniref:WD40 repeat domain-containing protein n=1 Tax=Aquirufa nivalisilvae TaxID=2516557 RepID=UPI001032C6F3|nr:two-component regulator propeller domain-containing protein [Aquirufa nivalisilvae]TBH73955.1 WD40 repeat domain-containing protein [Aquirufa nivalisilvae]
MQIERIDTFSGHRGPIYSLASGEQAHEFYSAGSDGWVVQWNLQKPDLGKVVAQINGSVYAMKQDDQGVLWVGQNFEGIHGIQLSNQERIFSIALGANSIFDILFNQNQVWVAHQDGLISVVDSVSKQIIKHIKASDKSVRTLRLLPQGRIAAAYSDGYIRIFNSKFELEYAWKAHEGSVFGIQYWEKEEVIISVGKDARIKKWKLSTIHSAQFLPESEVIAHMYSIHDLVFHPQKHLFASASMDKTIKIWDATDLTLLKVIDAARYGGHKNSVNKLIWTSFDDQLVSASDDKNISVWKIH